MQSKESRVTIFVVAVAVAIGLFFLFQRDDDSEPAQTPAEVTTQATITAADADSERPAKPKPKPKPEIPEIVVVGGEPKGGVADLKYKKGDRIKFAVRSDVAEEIHVVETVPRAPNGKADYRTARELVGAAVH